MRCHKPARFTIKHDRQNEPAGTMTCPHCGYVFAFADFHQVFRDGQRKIVFEGFCWNCHEAVTETRDDTPKGYGRDYRNNTFIEMK